MQSRDWCFTLNNPVEDEIASIYGAEHGSFGGGVKYIVAGMEGMGPDNTPHIQGFVQWNSPKTLDKCKGVLNRAHWEKRRGTPTQAAEYCKKEGDYFEVGTCGMTREENMKLSNEERWSLAKEGKFEELPPEHYTTYKKIFMENLVVEDRNELDNLWIVGPSGCGKSRYVRSNYPIHFSKPINKWWDGYMGEDTVVIDDLSPLHVDKSNISYFLKIWSDHYAFNAEVKGAVLRIRPKRIIVTSQYTPERVFQSVPQEEVVAILRRFTVKTVENGVLTQYRELGVNRVSFFNY